MSKFQHTYSGGETQCTHCRGWTRGANLVTECPTRLRAEVERLRSINDDYLLEMGRQHALLRDQAREAKTEREAVVAYLRELGAINSMLSPMKGAADDIERGEHRKGEG